MICILAGNYLEAQRWADGQQLEPTEWFYPKSPSELHSRINFHVIIVGTAGQNVPESFFNQVFKLAKENGRIGRT